MYVCMCVHSYLPPRTLELQNRDTNEFIAIQQYALIIEINRLVKRVFDVAGRELVALWRQQRGREHTLKTHIEFERSRIMLQ